MAFAAAAPEATAKISRTAVPVNSISYIEQKWRTVEAMQSLVAAESEWVFNEDAQTWTVDPGSCPLTWAWWKVTGTTTQFEDTYGLYVRRLFLWGDLALDFSNQRRLNEGLAALDTLNERVAKLAAAVKAAPDPCSVAELP